MPVAHHQPKLHTRTARNRLQPRHAPYWVLVSTGCSLGYRRGRNGRVGVWLAKFRAQPGGERIQRKLGPTDDRLPADGVVCLSFEQARVKAIEWFPIAAQIATGEVPRRGGYNVEQACADYIRKLEGHSRGLRETAYVVRSNIVPFLGTVPVENLSRRQVESWQKFIADTPRRKPKGGLPPESEEAVRRRKLTANRQLSILKSALNFCLAEGRVASTAPWRLVKPFRGVDNARTRFLTDGEAQQLARACPPDFRLLVRGALYSGLRYSELGRLQVQDFDPGSATLLVAQSKSAKARRIYLDLEALDFFRALCAERRLDELLFRRADGKRWEKDRQQGLMREAVRAAEIAAVTFHELRHSAASRWARLGLSLQEIARQLGHCDTRMTARYAHLCLDSLAAKVRALPPMGLDEPPRAQPPKRVQ
ncbi:MAG: site-specific integrase [Nitrospiraceae bacterium]